MYFFKEKRFLIVFLVMVTHLSLFSQEKISITDTLTAGRDTLVADTLSGLKPIAQGAIDKQVIYKASGYIKDDLLTREAILVKDAVVDYGDIEISADSIVLNMSSNIVFAVGLPDSTGKISGKPVFKQGTQQFESDTLKYNFKTKMAYIRNIVTQQNEGLLHSSTTKLLEDGTSNIFSSTYSTCDLDTPHFYIYLRKAKVYPGKKIISGPGNLVLMGIPLPLYIPFGYFPIQRKPAESGIIIPKPHYEATRGYALADGGYYFAVSDNLDLTLKGSIFTNGSWLASAGSNYNKRYRYSGGFTFSYADNKTGHFGLQDYSEEKNYNLIWNYNQSEKARPGSRFSANVNMSSRNFDRNNSYNLTDQVTTQRQSSVSYSKTWAGTPFNLSASMNQSQNIKTKKISLNLPKLNFNVSRIYPLKGKTGVGRPKWYQELQMQYTATIDDQIETYDTLLFSREIWEDSKTGFRQDIPVSIPVHPFKNFTISPQLSYTGVIFDRMFNKRWDPQYLNPATNEITPAVISDTTRGIFYGQAVKASISAGFNPQIFGTFDFTNPNSRIDAIRHVMRPSVSFSYVPRIDWLSSKMYRQVQVDTSGRMQTYNMYGGIYQVPTLPTRSGSIALGLTNIVQAHVYAKNDTTGKPRSVTIIDNLNFNTSYDIFADSLRWRPITMVFRTSLLQNVNISANGSFSLYALDDNGHQINTYYFSTAGKLMRLTSFNVGIDFNLNKLLGGGKSKSPAAGPPAASTVPASPSGDQRQTNPVTSMASQNTVPSRFDEYGYMVFDNFSPWSMNVSYSFLYSKPAFKSSIKQTLALNGSLQLTPKTSVTLRSGFDFKKKAITSSQIHVTRDLHCWEMSFDWYPNGYMKMWTFTIRVKAAVLADLKYERRKDYHDNY